MGDGLKDGEEEAYGTDPLLTDTDGDGYSDYEEVQAGSDPLDENSIPTCPGDFDGDGDVDGSDLAVFAGCVTGDVVLEDFAANFGRTDCLN